MSDNELVKALLKEFDYEVSQLATRVRESLVRQIKTIQPSKLQPGDVVALKPNWAYSASEWFGIMNPAKEGGEVGVVYYVPQDSSPQWAWVTFPRCGRYCVFRESLELTHRGLR